MTLVVADPGAELRSAPAARGLFSKSSSPQAASASAATSAASRTISLLCTPIVRATLTEPAPDAGAAPVRSRSEGQLDDLGGIAVADLDRRPRLGLAAQDRERDRAVGGGEHGGADRAQLALAEADRIAGSRPAPDSRRPRRWRLGLPL